MELELKKERLDLFELGGEVTLTQEETAETIVPDYCPDIARIITTEGRVFLHSREVREGKGELSGTVHVTVLYTPETEGGIRTLELAMPFTVESEARALPDCTVLVAEAEPELLETRMLNPRKVFTHCKLVTHMTGYRRTALNLCSSVEETPEESLCVEQRQESQRAILLTHVSEKDFTFTETMNLSPGREGAVELLTGQAAHTVTESKLVGSKLICKGVFTLSLLYRTAAGACCAQTGELPFSQILEVEGASENAVPSLLMQLTGTDLQIDGGDAEGRQIAVTLYVHATAFLREERELTLLNDLYSTAYEATYQAEPLALTGFWQTMSRRQNVREVLEIGVVAEQILSLSVRCGTVSVSREGGAATLRTGATVRALYLDEGGVPLLAERCVDVVCQAELPEDCTVAAKAVCAEEVQGSLTSGGIEVRFPVDFRMESSSRRKWACITAAQIDTETPKDAAGAPSLVLRCMGKDDCAWELAKRYNTTVETILAANQLEREEDLPLERLLLIPRKRA